MAAKYSARALASRWEGPYQRPVDIHSTSGLQISSHHVHYRQPNGIRFNDEVRQIMIAVTRTFIARPIAFLAIIMAGLSMAGCGINTIPTEEQRAKAAWSEVQNQYKRRSDLIPNLVSSVKGFADQEKSVLTEVTKAREQTTNLQLPADIITNPEAMKKFQDAQATLSGALGRLMAVVERYPDIKSGQNFLALQSELAGTENRIAIARRDYIEAVRSYNTEITTFPGRLWKTALYPQAKEMATFEISPEEQKVPKVDFSKP